jgi:hypothetical protein
LVVDGEHHGRLGPAQQLADVDAASLQVGMERVCVGGGEPDAGLDATRDASARRHKCDRDGSARRRDFDPTSAELLDRDIESLLEP